MDQTGLCILCILFFHLLLLLASVYTTDFSAVAQCGLIFSYLIYLAIYLTNYETEIKHCLYSKADRIYRAL